MKITIYELLGLIKDGKAPKKIRLDNYILELEESQCNWKWKYIDCQGDCLFIDYHITLNDEVEILEEVEDKEEVKNNDDFTGIRGYSDGKKVFSINYTGNMEEYKEYLTEVKKDIDKIIKDKEIEDIQKVKNKRFTRNQKQIAGKINELIDVVNKIRNQLLENK